eukprot:1835114-Prymnesium_polylepis.1
MLSPCSQGWSPRSQGWSPRSGTGHDDRVVALLLDGVEGEVVPRLAALQVPRPAEHCLAQQQHIRLLGVLARRRARRVRREVLPLAVLAARPARIVEACLADRDGRLARRAVEVAALRRQRAAGVRHQQRPRRPLEPVREEGVVQPQHARDDEALGALRAAARRLDMVADLVELERLSHLLEAPRALGLRRLAARHGRRRRRGLAQLV